MRNVYSKIVILALLVICMAFGFSAAAEMNIIEIIDAQIYIEDMQSRFAIRDFEGVIDIYEDMVSENIDSGEYQDAIPLYQYALGMRYLNEGKFSEANSVFSTLYEADDSFPKDYDGVSKAGQVMHYAEGRMYENLGEYESAITAYQAAGLCQDATIRTVKLKDLVKNTVVIPDRIVMEDPIISANEMSVRWSDKEASESYTVSYATKNGATVESRTINECEFTAGGLLPDTEYVFTIGYDDASSDTGKNIMYYSAKTPPAEQLASADYVERERPSVYAFSSADVKRYTFEKAVKLNKGTVSEASQDGYVKVLVDRAKRQGFYEYYLHVKFDCVPSAFTDADTMTYALILRTQSSGVYSVSSGNKAPKTTIQTLYIPVNELLGALYDAKGKWNNDTGILELYVNGQYVDSVNISITEQ